jgi:hemolysin D
MDGAASVIEALAQNWQVLRSAWRFRSDITGIENSCDEPSFLPANLAVIQTPPSPLARVLLWALCALVLVALIWATLGKIDVVVAGNGRTLPRANVQAVSWAGPGETTEGVVGVVRAIRVADGDHVGKGQILIELDPTLSNAAAGQAREALTSAELTQARSRALIGYLSSGELLPHWPADTTTSEAKAQMDLLSSSVAEYESKAAALRSQEAEAEQSRGAAETARAKIDEAQSFLEKEIAAKRQLADKGYVSKVELYQLEQQRIDHIRDSEMQRSEAKKAQAAISGYQDQLRQLRNEFRKESFTGLVQSGEDENVRQLEIEKAMARKNMLEIRAPLSGIV